MNRSVAILGTRGYPSYYGGFETAVRKLAPYLVDAGWDVTVYSRPGSTVPADPSRDPRVQVVQTLGFDKKSLSTLSYGFFSTIKAFRAKPSAVLIMNVANCFWLPLLKLRGIPTLVNVDGMEWEREKWGALAKFVFRAGAKAAARWADDLVFDAEEIARLWKLRFKREGVFIPYGGDERADVRAVPGRDSGSYALVVARFVPENSIELFVEAAATISRTHDVVLVGSAGYGGEMDELVRRLAEENPRVTWLGHVSDDDLLHSLWQNAGVYFHGHTVGGTNPALVQAMALGAPILAIDTVFNREVLGDSGAFVAADAAAIADSALTILTDPARQRELGEQARSRGREHYSWNLVNSRYDDALSRLANQ